MCNLSNAHLLANIKSLKMLIEFDRDRANELLTDARLGTDVIKHQEAIRYFEDEIANCQQVLKHYLELAESRELPVPHSAPSVTLKTAV